MKFSNKVYDILKWVTLIALPAVCFFYTTLDITFCWGAADKVAVVFTAIETLIGTLIGISTSNYNELGGS